MAINSLNFRNKSSSSVGKFSRNTAHETVDATFKGVGLDSKAKRYLADKLDGGGNITGEKFNDTINRAHEKGYISSRKAEKMKDIVDISDKNNDHWN